MELKMIKRLIIFCILLLLPLVGLGAGPYYIKDDGNNGNTGLSDAQAWADLTNIDNVDLGDGTDIYFKQDDTWTVTSNIEIVYSGVDGNNYSTIGCYESDGDFDCSGARPIIKRNGSSNGNWVFELDDPAGNEYMRFEYLDIQNTATTGWDDTGTPGIATQISPTGNQNKGYIVINNCNFRYLGHYAAILFAVGDHIIITNNIIRDANNGIYFGDESSGGGSYIYVANNTCTDINGWTSGAEKVDGHCIGLQRINYSIVEDNTCTNCYAGAFGIWSGPTWGGDVKHNIFRRNKSYGGTTSRHSFSFYGGLGNNSNYWLAYQNIFTNSSTTGTPRGFVRLATAPLTSGGWRLFNNTMYNGEQYGISVDANAFLMDYIYARNNIIVTDESVDGTDLFWHMEKEGAGSFGSNFFIDYNLYWTVDDSDPSADSNWMDHDLSNNTWSEWRTASNDASSPAILSDPLFTNAFGNEFTLSTSPVSPAINAGGYLTYVSQAGTTTTELYVADTYWFHGDFGLVDEDGTAVAGMEITLYDTTNGLQHVTITEDEITHGTPGNFTVSGNVTYIYDGDHLNDPVYTTQVALRFYGTRPDIGALESGVEDPPESGCEIDDMVSGHLDYCRDCGPCEIGEGDCDSDSECVAGAVCAFQPGVDYCASNTTANLAGITLAGVTVDGSNYYSSDFINTFMIRIGSDSIVSGDIATLAKHDILFMARKHYDDYNDTWGEIKAINPDAEIYIYTQVTIVDSDDTGTMLNSNSIARYDLDRGHSEGDLDTDNPGYFMMDGESRINYDSDGTRYLLDFGDVDYQGYANEAVVTDYVGQTPAFTPDGIFADHLEARITGYSSSSPESYTNTTWNTAMSTFITSMTSALHTAGIKFGGNRGPTNETDGTAYAGWIAQDQSLYPMDVALDEAWVADSSGGGDVQYFQETEWLQNVNTLRDMDHTKVCVFAHTDLNPGESGTDNYSDSFDFEDALWYAMGSYLIAKNELGNSYFNFQGRGGTADGKDYNADDVYYDEYDYLDLGAAVGEYTADYDGNDAIYMREFADGYVFVNSGIVNDASIDVPEDVREITHATISTAWSSLGVSGASFSLDRHRAKIFIKETSIVASVCPSYYANAILSWDGDHTTSNMTACDSSGTAVTFTNIGSTEVVSTTGIRTTTTNALKIIDTGQYMTLTGMTDKTYWDLTANQTMCIVAKKVGGEFDANIRYFLVEQTAGENYMEMWMEDTTNARMYGINATVSGAPSAYGDGVTQDLWQLTAYSSQPYVDAAVHHAVNPGDVTYNDSNDDWDTLWEEDVSEIIDGVGALESNIVRVGIDVGEPHAADDTIYLLIEEWALFSGYQADCTDLMGIND